MAIIMIDKAIEIDLKTHNDVIISIDYNNKAVILINMQKFYDAYKCCKQGLGFLEPIVCIQ